MSPDSPSIEALLLDVEGVICHPVTEIADRQLAALAEGFDLAALTRARNTEATYALWERYSTGALGPEGYWRPVVVEAGLPDTRTAMRAVRKAQRDAWWAHVDETVLALVDDSRAFAQATGRRLMMGLLSNSAPEHEPHVGRFAGRFDAACFSHRTGLRKPDPAAYHLACAALETPPERVLFLDDKPRNVDAARALGLQAEIFGDAATLRTSLSERGLLGG